MVRISAENMTVKGYEVKQTRTMDLREEFRIKKLGLTHDDCGCFVISQFSRRVGIYLVWTIVWGLYYAAMLGLDVYYDQSYGAEYFIYLTNWSYLVQAAFVFTDLTVAVYIYTRRTDVFSGESTEVTWYMKLLWILYNISNSASVVVTVMYYALLTPTFNHSSINKHLLNTIFTIMLVLFCGKPTRLLHVYQPMIYALIYTTFSIIYQTSGGDPIYPVLDWDDTGSAVTVGVLAIVVGVPVTHLFIFALYTLRMFLASKCLRQSSFKIPQELTAKDVEIQLHHVTDDVGRHHGAAMP